MSKGWYVLHTYSGYENKVEKHIRKLMDDNVLAEYVSDIKVPAEDVIELKDGKKKITSRKFLPGYILLEMDLPEKGWKIPCAHIKKIQGVSGFVGSVGGTRPHPISAEEARAILQKTGELKAEKVLKTRQTYDPGETIRIVEGPFESFTGTVEEMNMEKGKMRVMVGIFGRSTPVEVDFSQVEKI